MPGSSSYDIGYAVGTVLAAVVLAVAIRWVWLRWRSGESPGWRRLASWHVLGIAGWLLALRWLGEALGT